MSLKQKKYLTVKKKKSIKQERVNYYKAINLTKLSKFIITFAVIRDTALGSGNVLGIQLHSCHMNLEFKNELLKFLQKTFFRKRKKTKFIQTYPK